MSGAIAQRANERRSARRQGVVPARDAERVRALAGRRRPRSVDENVARGRMHDVIVANGRYLGGGMKICPSASPTTALRRAADRRPDEARPDADAAEDVPRQAPAAPEGGGAPRRDVTVDAPSPLPIELDGEQPGTTPVRFELVPRALRIRVPR
jgi:diacylglycerol kinase family enzyme